MGFGKFVLGGVCAVGAVIAAPVVVPAAGIALATSTLTVGGAVGSAAMAVGSGMAMASSATVATAAGVAAGAAGLAAGASEEKKRGELYAKGRQDGYIKASEEYEHKLRNQYEEFMNQRKNLQDDIEEYESLIDDYIEYINDLREKMSHENCDAVPLKQEITERQKELAKLKDLRYKGQQNEYTKMPQKYEHTFQSQYEEFISQRKNPEDDIDEYESLIDDYIECINGLRKKLSYQNCNAEPLRQELTERQKEFARLKNLRYVS